MTRPLNHEGVSGLKSAPPGSAEAEALRRTHSVVTVCRRYRNPLDVNQKHYLNREDDTSPYITRRAFIPDWRGASFTTSPVVGA